MRDHGARVVAISADTLASHQRFATSLGGLPFPLLADTARSAIAAYGVLNDKGTGARRSVFVVGRDGLIRYANPRYELSRPEHLAAVLRAVGVAVAS